MEEEKITSGNSNSSSWISATNWDVIHGSLDDSISFETPISEIEDDTEEFISPKYQLQLMKPSVSGPCEITISFEQKHEIRQVYVRSTARVYEIYYAPDQQRSNEYLCTVRCCTAAKEDTSLHESDTGEATDANLEGPISTTELPANKIKNDSGTEEDGWVEVKVPNSLTHKNNNSTERSIQDFYEATAQISDANPCNSLTLRLLSLQTQGCVHVEEIYIFAEPVESAESDNQVGPTENSAGSSLMAMLAPTLLNLSKTGNSRTQERHVSDVRERWNYHSGKSNETESLNPKIGMTKLQEEQSNPPDGKATQVEEVTKVSADSARSQSGDQVPRTGQGPDFAPKETDLPCSRIEKVLDHLVYRVGRLEAFCLRFEENLLKPISSIETRLQGLEKQLELLSIRSQPSEFYPSTRITAPEFSCTESQLNSLYNDGNDDSCPRSKDALYTRITAPEFVCTDSESNSFHHEGIHDHKHIYTAEPSFPIDDAPVSAVPRSCPGLVVTAPDFSNEDDDDNECADDRDGDEKRCSEVSELDEKSCSRGKPSFSIDDALASALAGFLSTASVQHPKLTETSEIITPAFPSEKHGDNHKLNSPSAVPFEQDLGTRSFCVGSNRKEHVKKSDSASCCSSQGNELEVMKLSNESPVEIKGSCEKVGINQTGSQNSSSNLISNGTLIDEEWFTTPTERSGTGSEEITQLEEHLFVEQNYYTTADETSGACLDFTTTTETHCAENNKNNSKSVVERTYSSIVDFELPILDVKFVPHENWNAGSSLEFLLDELPDTVMEHISVKDEDKGVDSLEFLFNDLPETKIEDFRVVNDDSGVTSVEQCELLSVKDKDFNISNLNEQLLVGIDGDLAVETGNIQDSSTCINLEQISSLI